MINVLSIISYNFLPPKMGGQKGIAFFYKFFSKKVNLTCVTTTSNDITFAEGYRVLPIIGETKLRYINIFYFLTLKKVIRNSQTSHLIIEHPYYGWLGVLLKYFCKVKLIVHSHNIESLRFKSTGKWWWGILWQYEKWVHKKADHNFFIQDNDRDYAIKNYKLNAQNCTTITYGFELTAAPALAEKQLARAEICKIHGISDTDKILLFNGTLNYKPNLDALDIILEKINPLLLANKNYKYKFVICGSKLPSLYNGLIEYHEKNIIYAGFVDDINLYFKGCDIFVNPVTDGGGIKTKVVEALGNNLSVVSTRSGATGIPASITNNKLIIVEDNDLDGFVAAIEGTEINATIPPAYFEHFYWGKIAEKAAIFIT